MSNISVIPGTAVDLISPFPVAHARRVFSWLHCYRNMASTDASPKTPEAYEEFFQATLPRVASFGVIDKLNLSGSKHEVPLVGFIAFEPSTPWNAYIHLASSRKAWKGHMMDEATLMAIDHLFKFSTVLRVSAFVVETNRPVRYMAQRLGFTQEAFLPDWIVQDGQPANMLHYGLTRARWQELQNLKTSEPVAAALADFILPSPTQEPTPCHS